MGELQVRRVVTGRDGTDTFRSDGEPPLTVGVPGRAGVSEVLWLDGPPADVDAGGDRDSQGFPLEPPPGGASARVITFPPLPGEDGGWLRVDGDDPDRPGRHRTDTLDLVVVLDGAVTLGLDDGDHLLGPGDVVIQRGSEHRWRPEPPSGCTYAVVMLRPDPAADASGTGPPLEVAAAAAPPEGAPTVRRLVTGEPGARPEPAPVAFHADSVTMVDLWQTGGPLQGPAQGGTPAPGSPFVLEPPAGGASARWLELRPVELPPEVGWHTTATIDVDIVLSGRLALQLPDDQRTELGPGDVVVQRGTDHRWSVVGDEPARMFTVMLSAPLTERR